MIHDWDKMLPGRWNAYRKFFSIEYSGPDVKNAFGASWRRHAYLNDHHWQHWVSISDTGRVVPHEMSEVARVEMLCDWIGAHKALQGDDLLGWYLDREETILIAPKTKQWLRDELTILKAKTINTKLRKGR